MTYPKMSTEPNIQPLSRLGRCSLFNRETRSLKIRLLKKIRFALDYASLFLGCRDFFHSPLVLKLCHPQRSQFSNANDSQSAHSSMAMR